MGEYAHYGDHKVKIGTCEEMYYLRYDQRTKVQPLSGNVDPVQDAAELRFRFPWPDEDGFAPGSSDFYDKGYERGITVYGLDAPLDLDHGTIQFTAPVGYNVCLPCPESVAYSDYQGARKLIDSGPVIRVHRNGFRGAIQLVQQRYVPDQGLVPILRCACGAKWREADPARIELLAVCLRSEGDRQPEDLSAHAFYHAIADRVLGVGASSLVEQ